MSQEGRWVCCQLGAREHYAVPRALHRDQRLSFLVTDAWVAPGTFLGAMKKNLRERFHRELCDAPVKAWNWGLLAFELSAQARNLTGWARIIARNRWFQSKVVATLADLRPAIPDCLILFSYSYTALEPFRFAKRCGWKTVLGQIDGGLGEERIMVDLHKRGSEGETHFPVAPEQYWESWREECALSDRIIVNSEWSRELLGREGISTEKMRTIPLAYSTPAEAKGFDRIYPERFSKERPLRVLFLSQVNLRKGTQELITAAQRLVSEPVEFWLVGPVQGDFPKPRELGNIQFVGPVSRSQTSEWYRRADVLIFPTHSDGFGLVQLEAQAWKLPVIASRSCGTVVLDGINGLLLREVSATAITDCLLELLRSTERLEAMAAQSYVRDEFALSAVGQQLSNLY